MIPPRRILAAVDFSPASRSALAFSSQLAGVSGAALHVLHALDPELAETASSSGRDLVRRTRSDLESAARAACPGEQRRRLLHVVLGDAAPVICDIAEREQADIVVLGVHGQAQRHECGDTAAAVIRRVRVPAMFVPEFWHPQGRPADPVTLGPVIAAVDQGQPSIVAATAAAALARWLRTRCELMHVGRAVPATPRGAPVRLLEGEVATALAHSAVPDADGCPILVMGRRTHPAIALPGSTVLRVVSVARAPVLMYLPED
jgi:nucleotide-binding universal stress UspA family protein